VGGTGLWEIGPNAPPTESHDDRLPSPRSASPQLLGAFAAFSILCIAHKETDEGAVRWFAMGPTVIALAIAEIQPSRVELDVYKHYINRDIEAQIAEAFETNACDRRRSR
jgi:hypothetical protein